MFDLFSAAEPEEEPSPPLGLGDAIVGSGLQLVINLVGMAIAGWMTLAVQHFVWVKMSKYRARMFAGRGRDEKWLRDL